ncbi:hypothetical protein PIB30_073770 [Stylosanthes scabra]|uniref:Putative plant transposon protein domain-containing protein n=1 Tax=Stylosanthes scabra TaxID=79078 RepID=A0ABU6UPE5_9FABA|nr:hypothetical protein [Stylosanthes scabra]
MVVIHQNLIIQTWHASWFTLITKKYTKSIFTRKGVTPEKSFELQEGQYPEVGEQIRLRGWRRVSKPRTKISKDLVLEFYTNAVRTEEELASGEDYPYTSFVRGTEVDFSAAKIREVLRINHMTLGAETDFKTRQYEDQRLDEVIRDICMPGAQWKMSSSQPPHPIQLRRQDLTPVARGGECKEEVNSVFQSTIYRLCKEAGVPMGEFGNTDQIQVARLITAKVMTTTRGRIINLPMEEDEEAYDAENLYTNHEQNQEMHYEEEMHYEAAEVGGQLPISTATKF